MVKKLSGNSIKQLKLDSKALRMQFKKKEGENASVMKKIGFRIDKLGNSPQERNRVRAVEAGHNKHMDEKEQIWISQK